MAINLGSGFFTAAMEDQITGKFNKISANIKAQSRAIANRMTIMGSAITGALLSTLPAFFEQEKAEKQLEAVLKSTGEAAGFQKDQLLEMAAALQKVTTFGDETIIGAQNILLTFTKIKGDVFPAAIETILDMSQALGNDLKGSAIQLGKALNDPIRGVSALAEVGVSFTEQQREQITAMVEAGNVMGAQQVILKELSVESGGSGRAALATYGGRLTQVHNEIGDLAEMIGAALMPRIEELTQELKPMLESMAEWIKQNPKNTESLVKLAAAIGGVLLAARPVLAVVELMIKSFGALKWIVIAIAGTVTGTLVLAFAAAAFALALARQKITEEWENVVKMFKEGVDLIGEWFGFLGDFFTGNFGDALDFITAKVKGLIDTLLALPMEILDGIIGLAGFAPKFGIGAANSAGATTRVAGASAALAGAGAAGGGLSIQGPIVSGVTLHTEADVDSLLSILGDELRRRLVSRGQSSEGL